MAEERIERLTGEVVDEKKLRIEEKARAWKTKVEETVGAVVETGKQIWHDHKGDIVKATVVGVPLLIKTGEKVIRFKDKREENYRRDYMYYSYEDHCWYELTKKRNGRINNEISMRKAHGEHDRDILRSMGLLKY